MLQAKKTTHGKPGHELFNDATEDTSWPRAEADWLSVNTARGMNSGLFSIVGELTPDIAKSLVSPGRNPSNRPVSASEVSMLADVIIRVIMN